MSKASQLSAFAAVANTADLAAAPSVATFATITYANTVATTAYANAVSYAASNTYVNTQDALKANLSGAAFTGAVSMANTLNVTGLITGTITTANNSTNLGGQPASFYAANSQLSNYALKSGGTFTGATTFSNTLTVAASGITFSDSSVQATAVGAAAISDFNSAIQAGFYRVPAVSTNAPPGPTAANGDLLVIAQGDTLVQLYFEVYNNTGVWTRSRNSGATWSAWQSMSPVGGLGQTWQDVTSSRAAGTTYTNSTGKPIAVFWFNSNQPSNGGSTVYINGTQYGGFNNYGTSGGGMIIVPSGATYSISYSGSSLTKWSELR